MADNILGFIAQIDVTDLKAGLSQVKDAISKTRDQFNTATAGLDKWQKSADGVQAKLTQLNTQLKAQEKSVELYEKEIERVSNLEGDHSKQLEILQKKLQTAKNSVEKTKAQISSYGKELEKIKKKEDAENSSLGKLNKSLDENKNKLKQLENQYKSAVIQYGKNSNEAKQLATQIQSTTKVIEKQEKQVDKLDKSYKNLTNSQESFKSIGKTLLGIFASIGTATVGAVTALIKVSDSTEELRNNQKRLETTFNDVGLSSETLTNQYSKLFKVIGDDSKVTETLSYLAQMASSEEELDALTSNLIGVYAKFGDSIPINSLAKATNEAIKNGEVTGALGDAIKQVGIDEDTFKNYLSILTTEEDRQKAIVAVLTDNYKELGEEFSENNKSIIENNEANLRYNESLKKLGTLGDSLKKTLTNLKATLLEKLYSAIETTFNFIKDNWQWLGTLTATIGAIGGAIIAVTTAEKVWNGITKTATILQTALNAVLNANPIGIIITAVTALSVVLGVLITNWDKVKEVGVKCWEAIKSAWSGAEKFFKNIWDGIKTIFANPSEFFQNVVNDIINCFKNLPSKLANFFATAWENIKSSWNKFKDWLTRNADVEVKLSIEEQQAEDEKIYRDIIERKGRKTDEEIEEESFKEGVEKIKLEFEIDDSQVEKLKKAYGDDFQTWFSKLTEWDDSDFGIEGLFANIEQSLNNIENQTKATGDRILTETEKDIIEKLQLLKSGYEKEAELVENDEALEATKANARSQLQAIQEMYDSWQKESNENNTKIEGDLNNLKELFKETTDDITESNQSAYQKANASFKSTMQQVYQTMSKWFNQIASLGSNLVSALSSYWQNQMDNIDAEYDRYCDELDAKQEAFEAQKQAEIEATEKAYADEKKIRDDALDEELKALADQYLQGKIDYEKYAKEKAKIEKKYNEQEEKSEKAKDVSVEKSNKATTDYAKQLADDKQNKEKELLAEKNRLAQKQFEAEKANNIAQVWIQAALAVVKALAEFGFIAGGIMGAAILVTAGVQTAAIAKQQYTPITALAQGGIVDEPTYALVGEAGKEAVMPLENNTGWISELASKLSEELYNLQGKNFAMRNGTEGASISYYGDTINNYNYEQTINSPTALTRAEIYRDSKALLSLKKY